MTVQEFIGRLGGPAKVAKALGTEFSTVSSWGIRGRIPYWWRAQLAVLAASEGEAMPATREFGVKQRKAAA